MEESTGRIGKKIPVTKILVGAITFPWLLRKSLLRVALAPVVVMLIIPYVSQLFGGSGSWSVQVVLSILSFLLFTYLAVACHRLFITGHSPPSWLRGWSNRETRFFASALVLQFSALGVILLFTNFTTGVGGASYSPFMPLIKMLAVIGMIGFMVSRLALLFPMVAVENEVNVRLAWEMGRGNTMRLAMIVLVLPVAITIMMNALQQEQQSIIVTAGMQMLMLGFMIVEIAALSLAYRELSKQAQSSGS